MYVSPFLIYCKLKSTFFIERQGPRQDKSKERGDKKYTQEKRMSTQPVTSVKRRGQKCSLGVQRARTSSPGAGDTQLCKGRRDGGAWQSFVGWVSLARPEDPYGKVVPFLRRGGGEARGGEAGIRDGGRGGDGSLPCRRWGRGSSWGRLAHTCLPLLPLHLAVRPSLPHPLLASPPHPQSTFLLGWAPCP